MPPFRRDTKSSGGSGGQQSDQDREETEAVPDTRGYIPGSPQDPSRTSQSSQQDPPDETGDSPGSGGSNGGSDSGNGDGGGGQVGLADPGDIRGPGGETVEGPTETVEPRGTPERTVTFGEKAGAGLTEKEASSAIGRFATRNPGVVKTGAADRTGTINIDDIGIRQAGDGLEYFVGGETLERRQESFAEGVADSDRKLFEAAAQKEVEEAEERAEGISDSDRKLFDAAAEAEAKSFAEGVAFSDRKLFSAAAEAERVGDINWTKVARGTTGPGGSDPFEERLDSFLDKRAKSIEDVGEAAGGFIRGNTERARPIGEGGIRDLANPTYQVRGFPADVVEGGFSLASDAVRAPSYALEGVEAAGFVGEAAAGRVKDLASGELDAADVYKDNLQAADAALEAGGVDVIDIEKDSVLEATEYERRLGTLGTVTKQAGSAAVEQARQDPSGLSGEVVAGFGAGAAVGGAARVAKGARIASRAPDAPKTGSLGRGATITRRGSSDLDLRTRVSERVSKGADDLTDYLNREERAQLGPGKDGDNIIRASDIFRDRDGGRGGDTADVDAVEADGDQLMKTKQKVRTDPGDVDMDARREEFLEKAVKKRVDDTEASKAADEVTDEVTDEITITVGEGATTTTRGAFAGATVGGVTRTRQLEQTATMLDTEMASGLLEGVETDMTAEIEGTETTIESDVTTGIGATTTPTSTTTTTTEPTMEPPGETTLIDPTQPGTTRRVPDIDLFGDSLETDTLDGGGQFEKEFENPVADPDSILSGKAFEGNGL